MAAQWKAGNGKKSAQGLMMTGGDQNGKVQAATGQESLIAATLPTTPISPPPKGALP